jgi:hypothetical protein
VWFSDDATSVIGIYLWETKDAADAFYSDEWLSGVTERWGAAPVNRSGSSRWSPRASKVG